VILEKIAALGIKILGGKRGSKKKGKKDWFNALRELLGWLGGGCVVRGGGEDVVWNFGLVNWARKFLKGAFKKKKKSKKKRNQRTGWGGGRNLRNSRKKKKRDSNHHRGKALGGKLEKWEAEEVGMEKKKKKKGTKVSRIRAKSGVGENLL